MSVETLALIGKAPAMHRPLLALLVVWCGMLFLQGASVRPGYDMDYGPFLDYTVQLDATNDVVTKGITVTLRAGTNAAAILFDTETLNYAAGWTGGWLDLSKTHLATYKGELPPRVVGTIAFTNGPGPGWAKNGSFADPRTNRVGSLPRDWARWRGLYVNGDKVVLSYTVEGVEVLEMPELHINSGCIGFVRNIRVAPTEKTLRLRIAEEQGTEQFTESSWRTPGKLSTTFFPMPGLAIVGVPVIGTHLFHVANAKEVKLEGTILDILGRPRPAGSRYIGSQVVLDVPPHKEPLLFRLEIFDLKEYLDRRASVKQPGTPVDPLAFTKGGSARFPGIITTSGKRGDDSGPFAVDTATIPEKNPWNSWMRLTALDFFSDGRAAVCTWNGDVWIVSGLDDELKNVKWKRFAAGLFDPLGLKIRRDEVFVLERHQITRLRDLNNDGEADFYENFNNDAGVSPSYHAFAMDLQTDSAGNFYYTRAGQRVDEIYPLNGGMVRVSADGSRAELIAHGLRAANGMGIGPNDEIVCSDNQGNWIPSSRINLIQRGGFHGYVPHAHGLETTSFVPPLCWIPMAQDNSGGGQVWVTGHGWPRALTNHLLHTSYGMAALYDVLWETVDGVAQGGVVKFPLRFDSGIQRARFNPRDGQLWVTGLKGWQTKGVRDGALQRVRYTGKPLRVPTGLHVRRHGIEIGFSEALDQTAAEDLQNYSLEQWNYSWTEKYGSDDFSVVSPEKKGRDTVDVRAARLSPDKKHVLLEIADLKPVMQMKIKFALKSDDGAPVEWEIYNTINRVPTE